MGIREGLLALLSSEPKHGYQLRSDFEEQTGGVWPLNIGQVYTTLERLARDERVQAGQADSAGRTPYSITKAGRKELAAWFSTAAADAAPPRDELMMKVLFAIATSGVDAAEVIDAQRSGLLVVLRTHRRAQQATGGELLQTLLYDALISRVESDLRWLDVCQQRLAATKKGPNQ
ncbi:MAG: PadR family transcriptional regulator [Acidimicrobiales bacterium]